MGDAGNQRKIRGKEEKGGKKEEMAKKGGKEEKRRKEELEMAERKKRTAKGNKIIGFGSIRKFLVTR